MAEEHWFVFYQDGDRVMRKDEKGREYWWYDNIEDAMCFVKDFYAFIG